MTEVRLAVRALARRRGFAAVALLALGLTTGLCAVVFTLVNALLLRPLPVASPDRLMRIYSRVPGELMSHAPMASADWEAIRRECPGFSGVAASFLTTGALDDGQRGRLVVTEVVSGDYFEALGVGAAVGRPLVPSDARPSRAENPWGGESVAVLSHRAWQQRFGADPGVVGRELRLNGRRVTVVGVAPSGFFGVTRGLSPELWLPLGEPGAPSRTAREVRSLWLVARLAEGASPATARAELAAVAEGQRERFPDTHAERDFVALPSAAVRVLPGLDPSLRPGALAVLAVVGLALLVANANLAQLLLVGGLERRREIAIRQSLGAPRGRLVRQLLAEGLVLAVAGGASGLALAAAAPPLLRRWTAVLPVDFALGLAVDWRVVLFTLAVPASTTLAFALAPALETTRPSLLESLRQGELASVPGRRRLRQHLVGVQLALAFVTLVAAGTAVSGLREALTVDPGFEARGTAVATLAPGVQGRSAVEGRALVDALLEEIRRQPGVRAAGRASHLPLSVEVLYERVAPEGAVAPQREWPLVDTALVGPEYLEAMGTRVVRGRSFRREDVGSGVAVVNEALASQLWPGGEAVGRTLRVAGSTASLEVVGVAATGRYRTLVESPRPFLFQSLPDEARRAGRAGEVSLGTATLVVRARDGARALDVLRRTLDRLAPDLSPLRLSGLAEATRLPGLLPRALATVFTGVAAVALLLVSLGVAGLAAYAASRRRHEIGVRLALGAGPADVRLLLLREAGSSAALGGVLGLALAGAAAPSLARFLTAGAPLPPAAWLAALVALGLLVAAAALVPASRAARADPLASLRHE